MRILIADDDEIFRTVLGRTVRLWGYEPTIVEDGTAAARILSEPDPPRIALLDWEMPGIEGPELCRRAAAHDHRTYCILLTVHTTPADISKGLEAGAHDFIPKPMHHLMLRRRLAMWRGLILGEEERGAPPLALEEA